MQGWHLMVGLRALASHSLTASRTRPSSADALAARLDDGIKAAARYGVI